MVRKRSNKTAVLPDIPAEAPMTTPPASVLFSRSSIVNLLQRKKGSFRMRV